MSNTNYNVQSTNSNFYKFFDADKLNTSLSPYMSSNSTTQLIFRGVAVIPLYLLHDSFSKMPSVNSSTNFELNLQMNIGTSNSWTLTSACSN